MPSDDRGQWYLLRRQRDVTEHELASWSREPEKEGEKNDRKGLTGREEGETKKEKIDSSCAIGTDACTPPNGTYHSSFDLQDSQFMNCRSSIIIR